MGSSGLAQMQCVEGSIILFIKEVIRWDVICVVVGRLGESFLGVLKVRERVE